jgi:hypothetical protein
MLISFSPFVNTLDKRVLMRLGVAFIS